MPARGDYPTELRETLAEAPGLRVRRIGLGPGQSVPWHLHTRISDTFVCLRGPMRVSVHGPDEERELAAGDTFSVAPGRPHLVTGVDGGSCLFLVIQGVGEYDYVPVGE